MKHSFHIYVDLSYSPKTKLAIGSYLILKDGEVFENASQIHTHRFESSGCSRAEIENALGAIELFFKEDVEPIEVRLFTDCKTLIQLPERRFRLEQAGFKSKRSGKLLSQADLYQRFFAIMDRFQRDGSVFSMEWIKGHKSKNTRTYQDQIFSAVDQAARQELRTTLSHRPIP